MQPPASGLLVREGAHTKQPRVLNTFEKRRLANPLQCESFYCIFSTYFYSNIICFITVKASALPDMRKADYSSLCSYYLLFIHFWYYGRCAEGISQSALEPYSITVVSPDGWDGEWQ